MTIITHRLSAAVPRLATRFPVLRTTEHLEFKVPRACGPLTDSITVTYEPLRAAAASEFTDSGGGLLN